MRPQWNAVLPATPEQDGGNLSIRHAADTTDLGADLDTHAHALAYPCHPAASRRSGLLGGGEPRPPAAVVRAATHAALARSELPARICCAHDVANAHRDGALAGLHLHLCDAGRKEQAGRTS